MGSTRLLLPDSVIVRPLTDPEALELAVGSADGRYLLTDDRAPQHNFVINTVIKEFLELFRTAMTVEDAARVLAVRAGCGQHEIVERVAAFSSRMRHAGVLRSEASAARLAEHGEALQPGYTLGEYTVVERLKGRREAEIYRGTDAHGRPVALKVLRRSHAASGRSRAEFRREFGLMRELPPHANVCGLLAYLEGPRPAAVLEYIDGITLREAAAQATVLLGERLGACGEALAALAHLHEHGVLHGDVHSRNFMLTTDGRVKLIDFGLARRRGLPAPDVEVHGGVPDYMPPERVRPTSLSISIAPGEERAEVYQLGVLLYEVLTGRLPYRDHTRWRQLATDIRDGRISALRQTPAGEPVPRPVTTVVLRSLSTDPAGRYASAADLCSAWRQVAEGSVARDSTAALSVTGENLGSVGASCA